MDSLVSAQEFARRLGISLRTLEDMIAQGKVPPHIKVGRLRRWHPTQVDNWIADQFAQAETGPAFDHPSEAVRPHPGA